MDPEQLEWLDLERAAARTPYSVKTLRRCLKKTTAAPGELPPLQGGQDPNDRWIIRTDQLAEWMNEVMGL